MEQGIVEAISENAINKTTLGYSGKNLFNPNAVNWYQPTKISIANDGTITSTVKSDSRSWGLANAEYFLTLQAGKYIIKTITESLDDTVTVNENIRGYNEVGTQIINIFPNIIGTQTQKFTITETTTIGFMFKIMTQACKIMIYNADITDDTYEPYIESVDERITSSNSDITINKSTLGYTKKNLLPPTNSVTRAGITYTVAENGKVILTGINTSSSYNYFSIPVTLKAGKYIISGMPSGGAINTYRVDLRSEPSSGTMLGYGATPFKVEISETTTVYYMIRIDPSYKSELNLTFEPMIRLADITDDTYEPYVPDVNTRLLALEDKQALSGQLLAETSFGGGASGSITIDNLASYSAVWAYIDGNVSGINFAVNIIIPLGYLSNNPESSVKLAGGIPSDAYITSSGPQAPKDTSGYIIASVNKNVLELELSGSGTIGNVKIVSM